MSQKKKKKIEKVGIDQLHEQLMERIDIEDLVEVEKVERYIKLVKSFRSACDIIEEEGESITTINGGQLFTKAHPLINERNKINASLIALGKDINVYVPKQDMGGGDAAPVKASLSDLI